MNALRRSIAGATEELDVRTDGSATAPMAVLFKLSETVEKLIEQKSGSDSGMRIRITDSNAIELVMGDVTYACKDLGDVRKPIEVFLQEDKRMTEVGKVRRQVAVVDDKVSEGTKKKIKELYAQDKKHEQENTVEVVEALPGRKGRKARLAGSKRRFSSLSGSSSSRTSSRVEKAARRTSGGSIPEGMDSSSDDFAGERTIGKASGESEKEQLREHIVHMLAKSMAATWKSIQTDVTEALPKVTTTQVMKMLSKVATKSGGQRWTLRDSCLSEVDIKHWPSFSADDRDFIKQRIENMEKQSSEKATDSSSGHVFAAPRNTTPSRARNSSPSLRKSTRRLSARLESKEQEKIEKELTHQGLDGGDGDVDMVDAPTAASVPASTLRRSSRERSSVEDPKVNTYKSERSTFEEKYKRYRELYKLLDDNQRKFSDYRKRFLDKKLSHEEREQLGTKIEREYSRLKDTVSSWRKEYNQLHEDLKRKKEVIEKLAGELKNA